MAPHLAVCSPSTATALHSTNLVAGSYSYCMFFTHVQWVGRGTVLLLGWQKDNKYTKIHTENISGGKLPRLRKISIAKQFPHPCIQFGWSTFCLGQNFGNCSLAKQWPLLILLFNQSFCLDFSATGPGSTKFRNNGNLHPPPQMCTAVNLFVAKKNPSAPEVWYWSLGNKNHQVYRYVMSSRNTIPVVALWKEVYE